MCRIAGIVLALAMTLLAVTGCAAPAQYVAPAADVLPTAPPIIDGLRYTLVSLKDTYYVDEPFQLALRSENTTSATRTLPQVIDSGFEIRKAGERLGLSDWCVETPRGLTKLNAGESRLVPLPRNGNYHLSEAGTASVYYCYFGLTGGSMVKPKWTTVPITVKAVGQSLVMPKNTSDRVAAALRDLATTVPEGYSSSRPGWSAVQYNEPMKRLKALGTEAVPALLANIGNYRIQCEVIQLLGDLKVPQAVPLLVRHLWMQDEFHDQLIIAKLADITGHPEGYSFHRHWFDPWTQKKAVATYTQWWADYEKQHPTSQPGR